jgi:plasmid stabilization system protein ParE
VNRRLVVRPSAERDLTAAATYYFEGEGGGERGLALASRFVAAIRASLTAIAETPLAWPLVTRTKRKYLVSVHDRFPFVIRSDQSLAARNDYGRCSRGEFDMSAG